MPSDYTVSLEYAAAVSLDSLNVIEASLSERVDGSVTLEITCAQDFDSADIAAPFTECVLYDETNTRRFIGWLDKVDRQASGDKHSVTYIWSGGMRWLERAYFGQGRAGLVILGGIAGSGTASPAELFSTVYQNIMNAAPFYIDYESPGTVDANFNIEVPSRYRADVTVADALLTLLQFAPTACIRWTYQSTSPKLNLVKADNTINGYINSATHQLISAGLTPRYDLLVDNISIFFMSNDTVVGYDDNGPYYGNGTGGDAGALNANRFLYITYDTSVINNVPTTGLAQSFAAWHNRLHIDGEVEKNGIDWNDYAGQLLGFSGSLFSAFSSYKTLLKEVTRDLRKGTTRMSLGVPAAKVIYKIGDFDIPSPPTPSVVGNLPFSPPSSGIGYTTPNNVNLDGTGLHTDGEVAAENGAFNTLTVYDTSNLQGITNQGGTLNADATPDSIIAAGTIKANDTGTSIDAAGEIECESLKANDTDTSIDAAGEIKCKKLHASDTTLGVEADGGIKAKKIELTDSTDAVKIGTITYTALEIERCDGKKIKILADATGWA